MSFRLTGIAFLLAAIGPLSGIAFERDDSKPSVPMIADDGAAYLVEPGESLGSAMGHGHRQGPTAAQAGTEESACVPEPMKDKPKDAVACRCYEVTKCKGNESHECKRHCRKDLCQCCDV